MVSSDLGGAWLYQNEWLEMCQLGSAENIASTLPKYLLLTSWGDDSSVGDNEDWLLVFALEVLKDLASDLLISTEGSVWDSDEEVLGR